MAIMTFTASSLWAYFILTATTVSSQPGWNYDGSDGLLSANDWATGYPACAGTSQSPINISSTSATPTSGQIMFQGYNTSSSQNFTLLNNGHTIQMKTNAQTIGLVNSRLDGTYVLEQLHFHWGPSDSVGSEHRLDGKFYPLEIHFVHYNSAKYTSVANAASSNDSSALLVLGVFGIIAGPGMTPTPGLASLISNYYVSVPYRYNQTSVPSFPLETLFPCQPSTVYTYSGSLTTPGCSQVVNWNVFAQPILVTSDELANIRKVYGENSNVFNTDNYRPIQPLNQRTVSAYNVPSPCALKPPQLTSSTMNSQSPPSTQNPSAIPSTSITPTKPSIQSTTPPNGAQQQQRSCRWLQYVVAMAMLTGFVL